ncbi:MAG: cysteine--tRNA ligase [Verrucomicrobiota bacterium JB024]|nr:cysteine--tRNA ligase [Verrucomicrobiota bacterium JB024]
MQFSLYNTLTRRAEPVAPMDGETFRFYCCGPTVYGPAHIGNFRTFVLQDTLRRLLDFLEVPTRHVRNVTDVDDKTIRQSQVEGVALSTFTDKWRDRFEVDCNALAVLRPHVTPSAVAHIPDQIRLIERLIEKGYAYKAEDGSVYYRIAAFSGYGKLSGLRAESRQANADNRLNSDDEYGKESWHDFALWKAWKPGDGENRWDSPWGPGRPGWHIECSAMSMRYLGESFDLHSGGVDLIFPHHENEIAQSEAATGRTFARHWFHIAHLQVDGAKMSKSLGNLYTLGDIVEWGYHPLDLRYVLISGHYRQTLNFSRQSLEAARSVLNRISGKLGPDATLDSGEANLSRLETDRFLPVVEALCHDLNTPQALGRLNEACRFERSESVSELDAIQRDLMRVLTLFGLEGIAQRTGEAVEVPPEIQTLAEERQVARSNRDWELADELRERLQELGWEVQDQPGGYTLRALSPLKAN